MRGEEGHGLTVAARRPEKLADAAQELRDAGYEVEEVPANLTSEEEILNVVARHRERCGRLDVLVKNARRGGRCAGGGAPDEAGRHAARPQPALDHPLLPRVRRAAAQRRAPSTRTRSALCPGFVETAMTEFIRDQVPAEEMIRRSDVAEAARHALHVSAACVISEIIFQRPGETVG